MVANGLEGVPWMIGGGAKHSANVGRLVAYAATGGADGVIQPGDLKVSASAGTADDKVHISTGACSVVNRYANAKSESYLIRGVQVSDLGVSGLNSSSKSSALVIVRVKDPQYGAQAPASVADGPYAFPEIVPGVPESTTRAAQIPSLVSHPAYAVARIDIPANASAITQGMIKDLRRLATPHYDVFNDLQAAPGNESVNLSDTSYKNWPSNVASVEIPIWATTADVEIAVMGLKVDGPADIDTRVNLGGIMGPTFHFDYNGNPGTPVGFVETAQHTSRATIDVRSLAGQTVPLRLNALRFWLENTGNAWVDVHTQVRFRVEFFERPL